MSETKYVIGNWKMNVSSGDLVAFFQGLKKYKFPKMDVQIGFAAPAIYAMGLGKLQERVWVGAQDVSRFSRGDYTGEISAEMIADCGLDFCLVGQRERRLFLGETDEIINQKLLNLQEYEVLPILFVGDSKEEREKNVSLKCVLDRLHTALKGVKEGEIIVAYEPWFDSSELKVSHKFIGQMVDAIKKELGIIFPSNEHKVLYSGEVTLSNSTQLLALANLDGVVLNECVDSEKFAKIVSSLFMEVK